MHPFWFLQLAGISVALLLSAQVSSTNTSGRTASKTSTATPVAVPMSKEPHHHLVLENAYVRVCEVEVSANDTTLLHLHEHDYLGIVLGDADINNTVLGKSEVQEHQADSSLHFAPAGVAHVISNSSEVPFRNVSIEFLHPQGKVKQFYPSVNAALGSPQKHATSVTALGTDRTQVFATTIAGGASWSSAAGHNRLIVLLDKLRDSRAPREKNAPTFPVGMVNWISAGRRWTFRNDSPAQMRVVVLVFKTQ